MEQGVECGSCAEVLNVRDGSATIGRLLYLLKIEVDVIFRRQTARFCKSVFAYAAVAVSIANHAWLRWLGLCTYGRICDTWIVGE